MKKHLIILQTILCIFIYAGASAQTFPVLPAPDYGTDHDAFINGTVTVDGSTQTPAGIVAILSRVVTSPSVSYVPVSYALTNTDGQFSLSGQSGVTYRVTYQYPTAGFTTLSGGTSANFVAATGVNTLSSGLVLTRKVNTITKCNVSPTDPTNWGGTILVEKPVAASNLTTLSTVTVFTSSYVVNPKIEISAGASASVYSKLDIGARIFIDGPELTPSHTLESTKKFAGARTSGPDQRIHINLGDKLTYYDISSAITQSTELDAVPTEYTDISATTVPFQVAANALTATENEGGNAGFVLSTNAAAGVCLVYTYTTNPLPVTLSSFTAKAKVSENTKTVALNWSTTSEVNSDLFNVERSSNTKDWKSVGSVTASVSSEVEKKYSFNDVQPASGVSYYRLKMIDKDATFAYSRIVKVQFEGNSELVTVYPNPVAEELFVKDADSETVKELSIFNAAGKSVYQTASISSDKGINVKNLASGMYIVKISRNDGTYKTQKIVIRK
ncbi:T9SS type A sorting domain-containing protein [Dyadobacter psychrotolerans]|nr:T9SS type A sorting domain-containing protein [Dyadobacter psychrotolerans]